MSPNKNAISCPCEHAVERISDYLGVQVAACIQLPNEALSSYLVVDHVAHSTFGASSSPKGKNRTPSGQDKEGAKANHPVYSSCSRSGNFPRRYRIVALLVVKISLIDRFFLIFHNFENVYLFSNPNISAKTVLRYT